MNSHEPSQAPEKADLSVSRVHLFPLTQTEQGEKVLTGTPLSLVSNVTVKLEVVAGETEISIGELFDLRIGGVLALDQLKDAPLTIRLDGKPIAHGELVAVDQHFGIVITHLAGQEKPSGPSEC